MTHNTETNLFNEIMDRIAARIERFAQVQTTYDKEAVALECAAMVRALKKGDDHAND